LLTLSQTTGLLISEFAASGKPVMPEGRRGEVIDLLTRLMVDPDLFREYLAELETRRDSLGSEAALRMLNGPRTDIPWDLIRQNGFADLADDVLADLATSPEALSALDETQFRGQADIGPWFFQAIERWAPRRPGAAERTTRALELARRTLAQQDDEGSRPHPFRIAFRRWLPSLAAAAACLLLGLTIGRIIPSRDGHIASQNQLAFNAVFPSATAFRDKTPDKLAIKQDVYQSPNDFYVTFESKQDSLAAVILFTADAKPRVLPAAETLAFVCQAGKPISIGPIQDPAQGLVRVAVILVDSPGAMSRIRALVGDGPIGFNEIDALLARIQNALAADKINSIQQSFRLERN
jgi:hypothetical protein